MPHEIGLLHHQQGAGQGRADDPEHIGDLQRGGVAVFFQEMIKGHVGEDPEQGEGEGHEPGKRVRQRHSHGGDVKKDRDDPRDGADLLDTGICRFMGHVHHGFCI